MFCQVYGVAIDGVRFDNWIYWPLTDRNYKQLYRYRKFTAARTKFCQSAVSSSIVTWQRLSTEDDALTLGSRTVAVPTLRPDQLDNDTEESYSSGNGTTTWHTLIFL
jgi:hypothetical protein